LATRFARRPFRFRRSPQSGRLDSEHEISFAPQKQIILQRVSQPASQPAERRGLLAANLAESADDVGTGRLPKPAGAEIRLCRSNILAAHF